MAPKRGAKAEEPAPPKRGAKAAAKEAPPKRGAKAAPEVPPKRGGAKAKAEAPEPPPPKRGAAKAAPPDPEPAPAENYDTWSVQKLQARLKELGVTATGSKGVLVERLKACAAAAPAKAKAEAAPQEDAPASSTKRKAPEPKSAPEPKASKAAPAPKKERTAEPKASKPPPSAEEEPPSSQPSLSQQGPVTYEDGEFKADYAKSNRSTCKKCKTNIGLGELRLGKMVPSDKFDGKVPMWYKAGCFLGQSTLPRSTGLISGFSTLRPEDQEFIMQRVPPPGGSGEGGSSGQDDRIREQNEKVFKVHDVLAAMGANHVKEMLELNGYPTVKTGVNTTLLELAADGIVFGATGHCEVCKDDRKPLLLSGEGYRCTGFVNEYLKCSFKTQTPPRTAWQLTEVAKAASGGYLKKLKLKTGDRLFASELGEVDAESGVVMSAASSTQPLLTDVEVAVIERGQTMTKQQIAEFVQKHGGTFVESISKATTCIVTTQEVAEQEPEHDDVETAKEFNVPGVEDTFLTDSVEKGDIQDMIPYLLWGEARKRKRKIEETVSSRFIEKDGVSMDADVGELASKAHVLVDMATKTVYSEMMNRTDLVTGINSFYTLHLLESDSTASPQYWVFRKWGRIGVSQGGTKVEECSTKDKAIANFRKLYEEKTGNAFGIKKDDFEVKKGKFIRVDMQHKVFSGGKKAKTGEASEGGGGGDQPLGQLSKAQIEKGDAVLDKIDAVLNEGVDPKSPAGNARYLALSAEFYSVIPHNFGMNKPPTISTADMVGAERALLQFYLRMGFEDMDQADTSLTPISGVMELPLPKSLEESAKTVCAAKDIKACDKKAVGLAKKQAGKPNEKMEASQYGAILLYTANAIYKDLNKCLRDEDRVKVERYFSYLRLLFEACRRLPQRERTLWRGIGVDLSESYKVGSIITWWGVSSCTSEKKVAQDFMQGCGDKATFLTVETKTACDISELSFYSNEAESILLPGTQLEVIKSEKMGKNAAITLREVGRCVS